MLKAKFHLNVILALLGTTLATTLAQQPTPLLVAKPDQLIAIIQSDATQKAKADACRQLAVIGDKDAVAPLAALLGDEKMTHMALFGLEAIPDPAVDEALREALGRLQGRPLVGVIGSLGARRDAKAVPLLAKFLQHDNPDVVQMTARTLGRIGTVAAAKAMQAALTTVAAQNQTALYEGLLRCAERLATNQRGVALAIYDRLRNLDTAPHHVRAGALRGAILARQIEGLPLLRKSLHSEDFVIVDAAIRAALDYPGSEVTQILYSELESLPVDPQIVVIQALGRRGDVSAIPVLNKLAKKAEKSVRLAALRALPEFQHASVVPALVELLQNRDKEIAQAAQEGLASVPGAEADAAVVTMLNSENTAQQLMGMDLVTRRRMISQIPTLEEMARQGETRIRSAAIRRLAEMGDTRALSALSDLLATATQPAVLDALEQALSQAAAQTQIDVATAEKNNQTYAKLQPAQKKVFLNVLTAQGGESALKTVRNAVNDFDSEVRVAALRALGAWKTPDAAPELLALAKAAANPTEKMLCLRGYLAWAGNSDLPADQRLAMCREVSPLIQQPEEKKLLLGALGSITTLGSLELVQPYLDDESVKQEASLATVAIATKVFQDNSSTAPKLVEPLQKAAQAATNDNLARRAKNLLQKVQGK